ncbi:MAG: RND family transporter [Candidatus Aminicenantes bacterium]|nr:MAG: RND family transporter [Candidatus Aminicenantes bacterium]
MKKFSELVIKYRKIIIFITIFTTLVLGFFMKDLQINSDIISYLPESDPVVKLFNYIGEEYGGTSLAMVALETDDIFNKDTIERLSHLTSQFKVVEGVSYVTSLANVLDIRSDERGIEIGRLIDEYDLPQTSTELQNLKNYTLSKDMYRGKLISDDSEATLIICRLREGADTIKTAQLLKEIVEKSNIKEKVYYGGIPFQMIDISDIILSDLTFLIPLILFIMLISLFISFRTLRGIFLPIISVSISTIWTLGIMSILKIPFTAISDIIPVILIAVGSAYSIHVVSKFDEDIERNGDRIKQLENALSEVSIPVILAGITTIAGFIAFVFGSYLRMIREFGMFSSLGVLFALITSITFVPSLLSILPDKKKAGFVNGNIKKEKGITRLMDKIGEWVLKNEKIIIVIGIVIVIASIVGIPRIERKVDMLDYFKPGSSIRLTEEIMENKFGGSIPIQILVKGDIQDPAVLTEMKKMEYFLESQGDVRNAQSIADLIEEMADAMGEEKAIPDSKAKVSNLWFLLEGEEIMSQLVNLDKTEAVIQATIVNVNTERIRNLVENIERFIEQTDTSIVTFSQTGMPAIYQHLDDSIARSQIQSLIIAIILIFICLTILLRSFVGGLIGLVPIGFTLLVVFGFMGFSGIPLDIATVLVGSISIGIGIDYSIHFVSRFREEFKKDKTELEALDKTLETTGKAILINVITVMMGFLVLILANVIPLRRFGILIAITMIGSGAGAITLLPAIILLTKAGFIGNFDRFIKKSENHLNNK